MKTERMSLRHFKDLLSRDEMKSIVGGMVYCMCIAYNEIVVKGACSGDTASECLNYAEDMGFTNCQCRYDVQY